MSSSNYSTGVITAVVVAGKPKRVVRAFEETQAVSSASARTLADLGLSDSRAVRKLTAAGVLSVTGDKRYYLNSERWGEYRAAKRRRAMVVLGLFVVVVVCYLLMQRS